MAFIYFILGILFTFLALINANETIWNPVTILLLVVATIDFVIGFNFLKKHFRAKNDKQ